MSTTADRHAAGIHLDIDVVIPEDTRTAAVTLPFLGAEYVGVSTNGKLIHLAPATRLHGEVLEAGFETLCGKRTTRMRRTFAAGRALSCKGCEDGIAQRRANDAEDAAAYANHYGPDRTGTPVEGTRVVTAEQLDAEFISAEVASVGGDVELLRGLAVVGRPVWKDAHLAVRLGDLVAADVTLCGYDATEADVLDGDRFGVTCKACVTAARARRDALVADRAREARDAAADEAFLDGVLADEVDPAIARRADAVAEFGEDAVAHAEAERARAQRNPSVDPATVIGVRSAAADREDGDVHLAAFYLGETLCGEPARYGFRAPQEVTCERCALVARAGLAVRAFGVHPIDRPDYVLPVAQPVEGTRVVTAEQLDAELEAFALDSLDAEHPAPRIHLGDRVRDLPADRTGDVVQVSYATGEGYAVRVLWDGGDGVPRQYSEDYLERTAAAPGEAWSVEPEAREDVQGGGFLWHITHHGEPTHLSYGSRVRAVEAMLERNAFDRAAAEVAAAGVTPAPAPQPLTSQQRRDRRVKDDEQVAVGTPVRVIAHGFGARRRDVGRWGVVVSHKAGQRLAVELAAANDCPTEVRRLHPDELVLELPAAEVADHGAQAIVEQVAAAFGEVAAGHVVEVFGKVGERTLAPGELRFACVQHGDVKVECGPECERLTKAYYAAAEPTTQAPRVLDEPVPAPAGWYAYGRRRESADGQLIGVGVVHLIDREGTLRRANTSACGRPLKRGAVVQSWVKVDCADCVEVALAANAQTAELDALDATEAQRRRGGHPGPARRTTSVRFTDEQYRRLDAAVEAGFGDGLNAVLARLIDEHLAVAVRTAVERA